MTPGATAGGKTASVPSTSAVSALSSLSTSAVAVAVSCCHVCGWISGDEKNGQPQHGDPLRKLRRCTGCKLVYYCSVACQRRDWKAEHRQICQKNKYGSRGRVAKSSAPATSAAAAIQPQPRRPSTNRQDVEEAWQELCALTQNSSLPESYQKMWQAREEVKRQKQREEEERGRVQQQNVQRRREEHVQEGDDWREGTEKRLDGEARETGSYRDTKVPITEKNGDKDTLSDRADETTRRLTSVPAIASSSASFVVEEMAQIGRYQLTLWVPTSIDVNKLFISAQRLTPSESRTLITIRQGQEPLSLASNNGDHDPSQVVFVGEFPRTIQASQITCSSQQQCVADQTTIAFNAKDTRLLQLHIRLPFSAYEDGRIAGDSSSLDIDKRNRTSSLQVVNRLVCGTCHLPVLLPDRGESVEGENTVEAQQFTSSTTIQRVASLPTGHWDDIADYLICYNGVRVSGPVGKLSLMRFMYSPSCSRLLFLRVNS